jgi:hypothetical protein
LFALRRNDLKRRIIPLPSERRIWFAVITKVLSRVKHNVKIAADIIRLCLKSLVACPYIDKLTACIGLNVAKASVVDDAIECIYAVAANNVKVVRRILLDHACTMQPYKRIAVLIKVADSSFDRGPSRMGIQFVAPMPSGLVIDRDAQGLNDHGLDCRYKVVVGMLSAV